ncbi:MAG: agmatinase [Acidobacteria bacterium]|nr:agmatinase [Acidobacteriota bacterium]
MEHSATKKPAAAVILLGIPFDDYSSYLRGAAEAPPLIRRALRDEASNMTTENGSDLAKEIGWRDDGDLNFDGVTAPVAFIAAEVQRRLAAGAQLCLLGGDHSVTYPIIRAFGERYLRLNILHLDAHPDLYDEFQGNRYSHACPFARILEEGLAARVVQVGIRSAPEELRRQARRFGVETVGLADWSAAPRVEFSGPVYLSLDMDVLDPAFAPGVSHREPGGLSTREVIGLIQGFAGRLVGADLVEYNPSRDTDGQTAAVAGKLLKEILGRLLRDAPASA